MTINDQSIQVSPALENQRNLTLSERSVQKSWGQQRCLEQHQSTRLRSGRGYSRLRSALPAQGRLCWHVCSCWLCQEGEGDLGGTDVLVRGEEIRVPSAKPPASAPCGSRRLRRLAGAGHAPDTGTGGAPDLNQNATAATCKTDLI